MKRIILCALVLLGSKAWAQEADTLIDIPFFTVQGIRETDSVFYSNKQAYYLSAKELNNAPVQSIQGALEYANALDVRTRGPIGAQTDLSIRGGSFDQSLVLIDGVKMSDPQTGHHLMNLPISLDQIERVEQINNGGSRWFGPYAFSGAVNLVTKRARENKIRFGLGLGDFGFNELSLGGSFVTDKSSTTLNVERRTSDGYIQNTDLEMMNYSLISHIDISSLSIQLNAGQSDREFGAQNFYSSLFPDQYEETRARYAALQTSVNTGRLKVTPRLYIRQHFDEFQLFRESEDFYEQRGGFLVKGSDTVPSWYGGPNYHQSIVGGAELNLRYKWLFGISYIGVEHRDEQIYSNNLGELSKLREGPGTAQYDRYASRTNQSLFFEHNARAGKLGMSFGMLANNNSDFGQGVFPGIDLEYRFIKRLNLFAGFNKNTRFPTYTDLYYNLGGAMGSIDLEAEESTNFQVGLKWSSELIEFSALGFYRQTDNLIDWVRFNGSTITEAANLTAVNFLGTELNGFLNLNKLYPGQFFEGIDLRYSWIDADRTSEGFESNYVLDYLKHKLFVGIDHSLTNSLKMRWALRWEDRQGGYFDATLGEEVEFQPYALVDLRLYQRTKSFSWYFEVANIFDRQYVDVASVIQPGRWLRLGLQYELSL